MRQRVLVSASAVALVALAAGGAALAVRDNGSHTPRTIMVQSSQRGTASEAAKVSASTASGMAMPYQNMNFVLSGDLPALDGDRPAFHFAANPTADPAAVAALAKTFGLVGEVKTVEGGWQVGDPSTGSGLFVNKAAGLPWYFSNYTEMKGGYACASAGGVAPAGDVAVVPTTVAVPPECVPPPAPTGVPTKDDALAKATNLLTLLGVDTSSLAITANASEWSADVQAVPRLDGIATPALTMSVGFGGEGKVQYANGFLLSPEKADTYPRIGTTKAFDALKAGKGVPGWYAYGGPMMRNSVASGVATKASGSATLCAAGAPLDPTLDTTTTLPACPTSTICLAPTPPPSAVGDKGVATAYPSCAPTPCPNVAVTPAALETIPAGDTTAVGASCPVPLPEPTTPPEPVTVTITGVHETLVPLMGADGSMWFMPGYEFTGADGGTWPVLAIDESYVQQVAPNQPTPKPAIGPVTTASP